jgi:LmbE family N-acetylglucosaminyl deacetylase|tara:strand:- start:7341 stop:7982 length:642 start_codon:yes stop_codon:yes gene_type:complete
VIDNNFNTVFVLSPHTDDGELGAGGFISKLVKNNSKIFYIAFSTAGASVPKNLPRDILKTEVKAACSELGIKNKNIILFDYEVRKLNYHRQEILEELILLREKYKPDLVLLPTKDDIHQDHSTVSMEGLRAFKNTTVMGYELIWNNLKFNSSAFVELSKENLQKKINALKKYKSQKEKTYMKKEFIESLAKTRGVQVGVEFAECFEVLRWIIK